jgi:hypothetical protein
MRQRWGNARDTRASKDKDTGESKERNKEMNKLRDGRESNVT